MFEKMYLVFSKTLRKIPERRKKIMEVKNFQRRIWDVGNARKKS